MQLALPHKFKNIRTLKIGFTLSKDVVLQEDKAPLCDDYAPANFAILRTLVVNLFPQHGYPCITKGLRHLAHDVRRLFSFFQ